MSAIKEHIHESMRIADQVRELLDYGDSEVLTSEDSLRIAHTAMQNIHKKEDLKSLKIMVKNRLKWMKMAKP